MRGVQMTDWRNECEDRRLFNSDDAKNRDRTFRKAVQQLRDAGLVAVRDGLAWVVRREGQANAEWEEGNHLPSEPGRWRTVVRYLLQLQTSNASFWAASR